MGMFMSRLRPFRNFNLEDRAHRVIAQDKPVAAPKHKSDQLDINRLMKEYPEAFDESLKKNEQLDKFLKNVFVQSHDPISTAKIPENPDRPLPLDRTTTEDFEYGMKEPDSVPKGKISLRKALQFITNHQADAKEYSVSRIANDHSISEDTIKNILKYFKVYEIYIPQQRKSKAKFAGPTVPRIKVVTHRRKQLTAGKIDKDET